MNVSIKGCVVVPAMTAVHASGALLCVLAIKGSRLRLRMIVAHNQGGTKIEQKLRPDGARPLDSGQVGSSDGDAGQ